MEPVLSLTRLFLLVCFLRGTYVHAKVAVLFAVPHTSYVRTHTNVGRALAAMGHTVYVCIPQFMIDDHLANVDGIQVISYGSYLWNFEETLSDIRENEIWTNETDSFGPMLKILKLLQNVTRQILTDQDLIPKLKNIKPDLFLMTNFPLMLNLVALPYMLNVPFAYMSPLQDLLGFRVPFLPSSTPCQLTAIFKHSDLSFLDRLKLTGCNLMLSTLDYMMADDQIVAELAPHRPPISVVEITRQAEIYLVENDHVLDFARPTVPNMKFISGTAATPGRPLKDRFKTFVEASKQGVAVVTFGSTILNIPENITRKMISAFLQQDLNVVWRVNLSSPDPKKILASTWIPQNDLLSHPNTKMFVSHCGANGQYETLYHGVPVLCLPLFGDQFYNAMRSTQKGLGLQGGIVEVTDTELAHLMKEVSFNPTYKEKMRKASALYKHVFKVPEKEAAFWLDHVMEYGGAYMRTAGQDMPLYQYLMLDILAFFLFVGAVLLVLVVGLFYCLFLACHRCCRGKSANRVVTIKTKKED